MAKGDQNRMGGIGGNPAVGAARGMARPGMARAGLGNIFNRGPMIGGFGGGGFNLPQPNMDGGIVRSMSPITPENYEEIMRKVNDPTSPRLMGQGRGFMPQQGGFNFPGMRF